MHGSTLQLSKLTKLQNDIESLNDRVAAYYVQNGELPVLEEQIVLDKPLNDRSVNDDDEYYVLDIGKLNVTLNYGKDYLKKESTATDKYIINNKTHIVYYIKGIKHEDTTYHTVGANPAVIE